MEQETVSLCQNLDKVILADELVEIVIDEDSVSVEKDLLVSECQYFKAWFNFVTRQDTPMEIKGGVTLATFKVILGLLGDSRFQYLVIRDENVKDVLESSVFLQCSKSEKAAEDFLCKDINIFNCFDIFQLAFNWGCANLASECESFILDRLKTLLYSPKSVLDILQLSIEDIKKLLYNHVIISDMSVSVILGWANFNDIKSENILVELLESCCFGELLQAENKYLSDILNNKAVEQFFKRSETYRHLSLKEKVSYWSSSDLNSTRWPKTQLLSSSGLASGSICFLENGRWQKLTTKPQKLKERSSGSVAICLDNRLLFIGGEGNLAMWTYNLTNDTWKMLAINQDERIMPAVTVCNNKIFIFGGYSDMVKGGCKVHDSVITFDLMKNEFKYWTAMDCGLFGAQAVTVNKKIYLLGGSNAARSVNSNIYQFDPMSEEVTVVAKLPRSITDFGIARIGLKLYLTGGLDRFTCEAQSTVQVFNLETHKWGDNLPDLTVPRKNCAAYFDGRTLCVAGGGNPADLTEHWTTEKFDFDRNKWITGESIPRGLKGSLISLTCPMPVRLMGKNRDLGFSNVRLR